MRTNIIARRGCQGIEYSMKMAHAERGDQGEEGEASEPGEEIRLTMYEMEKPEEKRNVENKRSDRRTEQIERGEDDNGSEIVVVRDMGRTVNHGKRTGEKEKRVRGCGKCEGCKAEDCGMCKFCRDKKKFGGENKLRQKCIEKRCASQGEQKRARKEQETRRKKNLDRPSIEEEDKNGDPTVLSWMQNGMSGIPDL